MKTKKLLTRIACIASSLLMLFCTACQEENASSGVSGSVEPITKRTFNGVHDFTATDLTTDLLKNGQTDYVLVKPVGTSEAMKVAEGEFKYLFEEATGVTLRCITDEGLTHNASNKYISLGETTLLETSGLTYDKQALGTDGVRILTKDNTVYLMGGNGDGIINAVYDFMQIYFNFETYYKDCFTIDKNVTDLKLKDFNVTDIPDVAQRQYNSTYLAPTDVTSTATYDGQMFNYRWRMRYGLNTYALPIYTQFNNSKASSQRQHNSMWYLPKDQYSKDHPGWYSTKGNQLCYTARGDKESFEEMALICAAKIINSLILHPVAKDPLMNKVTLTMEDNNNLCGCDACTALKEKYGGTQAASMIIMCNRIMEIVDAWMNETDCEDYTNVKAFLEEVGITVESSAPYKRDLMLAFFAYQGSGWPPTCVKNEETGKWEVIDDEVKMRDDVGVYMAMGSFDFTQSVYAPINDSARIASEKWGDIASGGLMLFLYQSYYKCYTYFCDTLSWYNRDGYEWLASIGADFAFNLGTEASRTAATGFQSLKSYIDAKLLWNSSQDIGPLVENYFDAMFGEASPLMYQYFTELRLYSAQICAENNLYRSTSVSNLVNKRNFWPYQLLAKWEKLCTDSLQIIKDKYEAVDPVLYQMYTSHIEIEWVSVAYAMISLHYTNEATNPVTADEALKFKLRFRDVVSKYNGMKDAENGKTLLSIINGML